MSAPNSQKDVLTLCLRLCLEPSDSHSPDTLDVLDRYRPAWEAAAGGMDPDQALALLPKQDGPEGDAPRWFLQTVAGEAFTRDEPRQEAKAMLAKAPQQSAGEGRVAALEDALREIAWSNNSIWQADRARAALSAATDRSEA